MTPDPYVKMTIPEVLVSLHSTASLRAQVFGKDDSSVVAALAMCDAIKSLGDRAENLEKLADGYAVKASDYLALHAASSELCTACDVRIPLTVLDQIDPQLARLKKILHGEKTA